MIFFAQESRVDWNVKKLTGKELFKLCLFGLLGNKTKEAFRLIEGAFKDTGETILLLSNLPQEAFKPEKVCDIYKQQWKIETFFRFLKQELNFKHYFSRTWTGIQVMICMILIASILLLVYSKYNGLKGYKIPKIRFCNQLQDEIIREIILHYGENPDKLNELFTS